MGPQQRWGNWLACSLIRLFWGARFTDLGPFRAVRFSTLMELERSLQLSVDAEVVNVQREWLV